MANPTPTPSIRRPIISIAIFTAAPLIIAPMRNEMPPTVMDILRPYILVTTEAKKEATRAAR